MEYVRLAYMLGALLVVTGSAVAVGVAYYVTRTRLAGASLGFVAFHIAMLLVHLVHKSGQILRGHYSQTATAFFMVFLFAMVFVYPYYFGAISGRQSVLTTVMLIVAAVVATVTKLVFDSLVPNIVLMLAFLTAAVVGFTVPGGEAREREHHHVRALAVTLSVSMPFLLIDLFEESAMRIAGNPLEVSSIDFFPAVFAVISLMIAIHHVRGLRLDSTGNGVVRSATAGDEAAADPWRHFDLSIREREVAGLAAQGMGNGAIAAQLFISESTVKKHLNSIFRKTGFESRHRLIAAGHQPAPAAVGPAAASAPPGSPADVRSRATR